MTPRTPPFSSSRRQEQEQQHNDEVTKMEGSFTAPMLKDCWGRSPLLIRGAFRNVTTEHEETTTPPVWPSWKTVMELAREEDGTRIIRHIPGDLTSYSMDVGPFDKDQISDILQSENNNDANLPAWTVVVNDVDRFHPSLSDWMDRTFSFLPRWRRDDAQISLANQFGGIGPHVDNYDVFLIQTSGRREWQVGLEKISPQEELDWSVPGISVRILQDWDTRKMETFILEPGDVLYLPPRVPHCGTAITDRCMTVSVGCRAPSAIELLSKLTEEFSDSVAPCAVARYQDLDLLSQITAMTNSNNHHELTSEIKKDMKTLVMNVIQEVLNDDNQWDSLVGRLVTEPKRPQDDYPLALEDMQWRDELGVWGIPDKAVEAVRNGEGVLYRSEGVSATYSQVHNNDGTFLCYRLFMNGSAFDFTVTEEERNALQSLLAAIVGDPVLTMETLSPLSHQPLVLELLENLVERGLLYGTADNG